MIGYRISLFMMRSARISRAFLARLRGKVIPGVRVAILENDRVVLVRHWYAPFVWMLPGGGINDAEAPEAAAIREVKEETGLDIESPICLGSYPEGKGGVMVFAAHCDIPLPKIRNIEIMNSRQWPIAKLPKNVYPGTEEWVQRSIE